MGGNVTLPDMHCRVATEGVRERGLLVVLLAVLAVSPAVAQAGQGGSSQARGGLRTDPLLDRQWPLQEADVPGGRTSAWRHADGRGITVAVVDTGLDLEHPDLAPNLWVNPDERAGNGIDDDANGIMDDVHGADLADGDGDPADDEGHGTHVAALIAARGGDGRGMAGVAPAARIMAVKVLDRRRHGTPAAVAAGVRYAVAEGARIINLSVNGDQPSAELDAALGAAWAAGAIVVASAGNDGRDLRVAPSYPASSTSPAVLSVGAVDRGGRLARFSNRGAVDLLAPGAAVLSAAPGGGYALRSGTSMAAAMASGALALLRSARPDLSLHRLRATLVAAATANGGRLDVADALRRLGVPQRASAATTRSAARPSP
jgi:subtilisin family serine protease